MKKLLLILLVTIFYLNPKPALAAEQSLRVSPVIINITLSPGKTYTHEVTVENLTNTPLPLRASLNDFLTSGEEGGFVFEETQTNPLLSWIKLNETQFILNPKEKRTLQMTITTPRSIPLGGYYGVLFFEPVTQNPSLQATRVSSKIGVLMLANVGVTDPNATKAEIVDFSTDLVDKDGSLPLMLRAKNISLNFFTAKPILTISPLIQIGNQSKEIILEDKIIFPGQIRRWTEQTSIEDLSPNIYKAHMAVATGNGQSVSTERYFLVFPFTKTLLVIGALILILFFIIKRNRLRQALRALYK
jgi:hypothetical protein